MTTLAIAPVLLTPQVMNYAAIREVIALQLATHGWLSDHRYTLGFKNFDTTVGQKTAYIEIENFISSLSVVGNYSSEGKNALRTTWLNIYPTMTMQNIMDGVDVFAKQVDEAISATYAMRLYALGVRP